MKPESTKILVDVTSHIARQMVKATVNNDAETSNDLKFVLSEIARIMRIETPVASGKFNIWNCVAKDETRPAMCCVYYDNGYKVASDAHVLVALKENYDERMEGAMQRKGGSLLVNQEGLQPFRYPKWRDVIPHNNTVVKSIDIEKFYNGYKDLKAARKLNTCDSKAGLVKLELEDDRAVWMKPDTFKLLADFMNEYSSNELLISDDEDCYNRRPVLCEAGEHKMIVMPVVGPEKEVEEAMPIVELIKL